MYHHPGGGRGLCPAGCDGTGAVCQHCYRTGDPAADHLPGGHGSAHRPAKPPAPTRRKQNRLLPVLRGQPGSVEPGEPQPLHQHHAGAGGRGRTGPGRDRLRHPYPEHRCSAWGTHQRADRQAAGCLHPPRQRHSWCSYPARCRGAPHSSTKGSGLQRHPLLPSPGRAGAVGCLRPVRCAGNGRTERRMERAEKSLRLCSVL